MPVGVYDSKQMAATRQGWPDKLSVKKSTSWRLSLAQLVLFSQSLSENWKGSCDEGFWPGPRRRDRSIPAAGCNGRANGGPGQKTRRPEGFRGKGQLASLFLGRRQLAGMLPRHASPSGLFRENRIPSNFQTGSHDFRCRFLLITRHFFRE